MCDCVFGRSSLRVGHQTALNCIGRSYSLTQTAEQTYQKAFIIQTGLGLQVYPRSHNLTRIPYLYHTCMDTLSLACLLLPEDFHSELISSDKYYSTISHISVYIKDLDIFPLIPIANSHTYCLFCIQDLWTFYLRSPTAQPSLFLVLQEIT